MNELLKVLEGNKIILNHEELVYEVSVIDSNIIDKDSIGENTITFLSKENKSFKVNWYNIYSYFNHDDMISITLGNHKKGLKF